MYEAERRGWGRSLLQECAEKHAAAFAPDLDRPRAVQATLAGLLPMPIWYILTMLHEQVREARIERGLSQVQLAKLSGVPRSQLRKFENGEGITMTTFYKIIAHLPNLEHLTIDATKLQLQHVNLDALRDTLTELISAAAGVLAVLPPAEPRTASADSTGRHASSVSERQRAEELNAIAADLSRAAKARGARS
jgi:transcriptional regulator with XRE-family HTH domain